MLQLINFHHSKNIPTRSLIENNKRVFIYIVRKGRTSSEYTPEAVFNEKQIELKYNTARGIFSDSHKDL